MDQWSGTNFTKLLCLFLVGIPAVTGAFMHQSGKMWPILTIGFGVYALIFVLGVAVVSRHWIVVGFGLFGGCIIRIYMVLLPESFPGRDLYWFSLAAQRVVESGSTSVLDMRFYGTFSGFIIYLSELFQIFGSPKVALVAIGIASGIVFPLGVGYFTSAITANSKNAAIATALAAISQSGIRLGVSPIAQTLHVLTVALVAGIVIRYYSRRDLRLLILMLIFLTMWAFTHKLPLDMFGGSLLGILVIDWAYNIWQGRPLQIHQTPMILLLLTGVAFTVQQAILSKYLLQQIIGFLFLPVDRFGFSRGPVGGQEFGPVLSVFETVSNLRVIVIAGAVAMLILSIKYTHDRKSRAAVGIVGGAIAVVVTGIVGWVALGRLLRSLIPLVIAVIGATYIDIEREIPVGRICAVSLLVLIAVTQAGTPAIALDDPRSAQIYLDSQDTAAKEWGTSHATETVYSDSQFKIGLDPDQIEEVAGRHPQSSAAGISGDSVFPPYEIPTKSYDHHGLVVSRTGQDYFYQYVYEFYSGLSSDRRSDIYNNGDVTFSNPANKTAN
jgi:hypothetical protein